MKFKGFCQVRECTADCSEDCARPSDPSCYITLETVVEPEKPKSKPPGKTAFAYPSEVETGQRYRDPDTGFEGVAIAVHFYQYGCDRVTLRCMVDHKIVEWTFDAPGLELVANSAELGFSTGKPADFAAASADISRHGSGR